MRSEIMVISPKVVGVFVTYNPDLILLNDVLRACSMQLSEIIVVDNFSNERDKLNKVISDNKVHHFIQLDSNQGLAKAQNIAVEKVLENKTNTHVIFFDQDSIITEGFISNLLNDERELIANGVKLGAIGPTFIDPMNDKMYPATVYIGPFIKKVSIKDEPIAATFIIASGCMVQLEVLKEVGLMKEELFIDYIDVEWCLRAKSLGYEVYISPDAKMMHTIGDKRVSIFGRTISVHNALRRYFLVRNSFLMLRLPYVPVGYKVREMTFNILRLIISVVTAKNKMSFIKYAMVALKDGILGNFGPCKYKF